MRASATIRPRVEEHHSPPRSRGANQQRHSSTAHCVQSAVAQPTPVPVNGQVNSQVSLLVWQKDALATKSATRGAIRTQFTHGQAVVVVVVDVVAWSSSTKSSK
jgi:hypothetical protein